MYIPEPLTVEEVRKTVEQTGEETYGTAQHAFILSHHEPSGKKPIGKTDHDRDMYVYTSRKNVTNHSKR